MPGQKSIYETFLVGMGGGGGEGRGRGWGGGGWGEISIYPEPSGSGSSMCVQTIPNTFIEKLSRKRPSLFWCRLAIN